MTKFILRKTLKSIAQGKVTFDRRVAPLRVASRHSAKKRKLQVYFTFRVEAEVRLGEKHIPFAPAPSDADFFLRQNLHVRAEVNVP